MPEKLYELRVFRNGRGDSNAPIWVALDLADAMATRDLLNRHLMGYVLRQQVRRGEVHEFSMEVRGIVDGYVDREPLFEWALPVDPDEMRR